MEVEYHVKTVDFYFQHKKNTKKNLVGFKNKDTDDYEDSEDEYIDVCRLCGVVLYSYDEVNDHQSNYLRYSVNKHN